MPKVLNRGQLAIIGMICMIFQHVYSMWLFQGSPQWLNMVGHLSLPIFLFLGSEVYFHSQNRLGLLKGVIISYWVMSVINYALPKLLINPTVLMFNNLFGTFLLSGLLMLIFDSFQSENKKAPMKGFTILAGLTVYSFVLNLLIMSESTRKFGLFLYYAFPSFQTVEGGVYAVILGVLFYVFRKNLPMIAIVLGVISLVTIQFDLSQLINGSTSWMMFLAIIPIGLYNDEPGKNLLSFFYIFYPAHIVILYILATIF